MSRKRKHSLALVLLLTALGITASADAADEFHCSNEPCRLTAKPDGTGKSAHHILIFENETTTESVVFTCGNLNGEAQFTGGVAAELTLTNLSYSSCNFLFGGEHPISIIFNGCDYRFRSVGGTTDEAKLAVICPAGKVLEIKYGECSIAISSFESAGVGLQTVGVAPNREITATLNHLTIPTSQIKFNGTKNQCFINPSQNLVATYTTGNTLFTGETEGGVMADAWYQ